MLRGDSYHRLDDSRRAVDFNSRRDHGGQAYALFPIELVLLKGEQR